MTYEAFSKQYKSLFERMMTYKPDEVGSAYYAGELAKLSDDYPEFEKRIFDESIT